MNSPLAAKLVALFVTLAATFAPVLALAQMIPIQDGRETSARATYQGITESLEDLPPTPYSYWQSFLGAYVEKLQIPCEPGSEDTCVVGSCLSSAFQISEFFPGGLQFSGGTGARWQGDPSGDYGFLSLALFRFRIDTAFDYRLNAMVDPGDWPSLGLIGGHVALYGSSYGVRYHYLESGALADSGRLGPGEYVIEGLSSGGAGLDNLAGAVYFAQWIVTRVPSPLIGYQPWDVTVACGGTAVFSVVPTGPLAGLTFLWRRNLIPLTDNGHVTGSTTQTLSIDDACDADAGYYDVVLSDGTVLEPSRLARLTMTTIAAVEVPSEGPSRPFSISAAGPNPFSSRMSFHYAAAVPQHATIAIYNAAGAKIRSLRQGMVHGSGTIAWDGDTDTGARAPAGIYFLRAEAGSIRETRKVVLVR